MELLDNQDCRFDEKRFVVVPGSPHTGPQPRVGPVGIVRMGEAHVPNRPERLKLFGLPDHLNRV